MIHRKCARSVCAAPAVATVTMQYDAQRIVVAELSDQPDPGVYDLCLEHAEKLTAPRDWEIVQIGRLSQPILSDSSVEALAEAIRRVGEADDYVVPNAKPVMRRRRHLAIVDGLDSAN